jgi:hypothetical protein
MQVMYKVVLVYSNNGHQIDIKKSRQEHSSSKFMARKFEIGLEMKNDIKMILKVAKAKILILYHNYITHSKMI